MTKPKPDKNTLEGWAEIIMKTTDNPTQLENKLEPCRVKQDVLEDWLKPMCQRLRYGRCSTLYCLKRGGYKGEPADYSIATCEAYEAHNALSSPASSPVPPEQFQPRVCIKCGHEERFSDNEGGKCEKMVGEHFSLYCGCVCALPAATPAPVVEQERDE